MGKTISLFWPTYNGKEVQAELRKLFPADMSNRWLGQAHKVEEFEREFGNKFNYRYCLATNSGTAALDLAYHVIGIARGDEVITPVLTCTATNLPLLHLGAKIIFADVQGDLTISPKDVASKITPKTKLIVAVTLGGMPVDTKLFALAKRHKIPVLIDASQSVGISEQRGDYICYSFQAIKHFTTGDGGMLVLRNKKEYARAKKLRWFGIDREAKIRANWQPYKRRQMTMDIVEPGFKSHMNDISASIGLVGMRHSDEYLEHRKKIGEYYKANLKCPTIIGGSYWLAGVLVDDRDAVAKKLAEAGIETNLAHLRNDIFTAFGKKRQALPVMNALEPKYLYIPINIAVSLKDARHVVAILNAAVQS